MDENTKVDEHLKTDKTLKKDESETIYETKEFVKIDEIENVDELIKSSPKMDEQTRKRYEEWKRNRIRKRVILPGVGILCALLLILTIVVRISTDVARSSEESIAVGSSVVKSIAKDGIEYDYLYTKEEPILYLFNAHPLELIGSTYDNQFEGEMSIVELTYILADLMESHSIPTLVEERCVDAKLHENEWDFALSYYAARYFVDDAIKQYPSLEFFLDVHRDGIPHEYATVEIDGENYARILFVIGTDNPKGYDASYEVARELTDMLEERKPGITREIFFSGDSPGRDGVYSQDISPMVHLVEVGTITSTVEEAERSIEILAEVLAEYVLALNEDEIPDEEEIVEEELKKVAEDEINEVEDEMNQDEE